MSRICGVLATLVVSVLAASLLPAHASGATIWQRLEKRCEPLAGRPLPYPWPLAPFHREHPVRGYFGDPRTVISGRREGAFSFHNGVDISAWRGNNVYAVVSGTVADVDGQEVVVRASFGRRFQYIHLFPDVRLGQRVVASKTVIGVVPRGWSHVHLTEIRGGCAVNPLAPGHLTPFRDTTRPVIRSIRFESQSGRVLPATEIVGRVRIVAAAQDASALPAPGQWARMPVAPALLVWELTTVRRQVLMSGVGADFRYGEPPAIDFCSVYAPGTVQNFAAVLGVYQWARPGRYLFDLTPRLLDTDRLHPGRYLFTVTARNLGGHSATRTVAIQVRRPRLELVVRRRQDPRCA